MVEVDPASAQRVVARGVRGLERWFVPLALAVPFLVMIAVLRGMTVALPIFHGSDERVYQLPTVMQFARELPFPDLHGYPAAQTPLLHLVLAYAGQVIGYSVWTLRLVVVGLSYLLVLAVYGVLRRHLQLPIALAAGLAMLFELSPYVFGQSFRVVTDNFAMLWVVLAIDRLERFRASRQLRQFALAGVAVSAGILTRQSTAFLVPVAITYALIPALPLTVRQRGLALAGLGFALAPPLALFLNWHGLIPPGSFPGSCGLCSQGAGSVGLSAAGFEPQTTALALTTVAIYGLVLFSPGWVDRVRSARSSAFAQRFGAMPAMALIGALLGCVFLVVSPARPGTRGAGDLWVAASHLPSLDGSSLLFWVFVPAACALLSVRVPKAPERFLAATLAVAFLVSTVLIRNSWQKYVDPFALLILFTTIAPNELGGRRAVGAVILGVAFVAYAGDYSAHQSTPPPHVAHARSARSARTTGWFSPPVWLSPRR